VGEVPEEHNSEFYALSGAGVPPKLGCEIVHISRHRILQDSEEKWEKHRQALETAHSDHFWIGVSCPKDDGFSDVHVRLLLPMKLTFTPQDRASE